MTDAERCYATAVRILNHRFNSEAELKRKLRSKQFDKETIDATMVRLHKEKWLDDSRFAGAFTRTKANKRVGKLRILRELQYAGVNNETATKAVQENIEPEREAEALRELCAKRARMLVRRHGAEVLETAEGRNKLAGYLLKQGYDAALVYACIREIARELRVVDHQPDS
jgi:regulatory protein